jgi:Domain of unknown function (DUF4337)
MPEAGIETHELREQLEEQRHHAGGHGHEDGPSWMTALSLSTALIAAIAAVAALYAGSLANEAIVLKNDAVLLQAKASDEWAFYQSKKIKQHLYDTQSELMPAEKQEKFRKEAEREKDEAKKIQDEARELDKKVTERNEQSEHALHVHHLFARAVTIFQVAIALAAIAALSKKRPMWYVSLVGGALGIFFAAQGFMAEHPKSGGHGEHAAPPGASAPAPEHH